MARRASLPHVDPTVESALIAVAGTVVVAVAGFLTTWAVTRRTTAAAAEIALRANDSAAEIALRARLWERQAAIYIEVIKAVEERMGERTERLRSVSTGGPFQAFGKSTRWHELFPAWLPITPLWSATRSTLRQRRTRTSAIYMRSIRP